MTEVSQRPVKVLLVQGDPDEAEGVRSQLAEAAGPPFELERVERLAEGLQRLAQGGVDVVLLDLKLPDSEGLATFDRMYAFAPDVPIVVLAGTDDETLGVSTVQGGAQDYLVKGRVDPHVLIRALRYSVERHRLLTALRNLSLIDDLTGLYNRRGFVDLGDQHLKLARRTKRGATLVLVDVKQFREINESLGHHVGDRVLLKVAEVLRATFRGSDILARLEGDEFAVLALEASSEDSRLLVERLLDRVRAFNRSGREAWELSLTMGVARSEEGIRTRVEELLAEADAIIFRAKREGREAVVPEAGGLGS